MPDSSTALPELAIDVTGLTKTYAASKKMPAKQALKGVDLAVPRGSIFGLLGPNGAGKSTMINILAGLVNKTSGGVKVWGIDADKHPRESRAALGIVPQEINMDPFFTPRERAELAWTESLTLLSQTHAPDEDYEQLAAEFSAKEMVDLTVAITTINSWNRLAVGFRKMPQD